MFGLNSFSHLQIPSFSRIPLLHSQPNLPPLFVPLRISKRTHPRFILFAQTSSNPTQEPRETAREMINESSDDSGGGDLNKDYPPPPFSIKWGDLLLSTYPEHLGCCINWFCLHGPVFKFFGSFSSSSLFFKGNLALRNTCMVKNGDALQSLKRELIPGLYFPLDGSLPLVNFGTEFVESSLVP